MSVDPAPSRWTLPPTCLLVTGRPGAGKSTVMRRVADLLPPDRTYGFLSDEVRINGRREGFSITAVHSGETGVLAAPWIESDARFGSTLEDGSLRLGVDLTVLEGSVIDDVQLALKDPLSIMLFDELGPMQALSARFRHAIDSAIESNALIFGSIAERPGHPWLDAVRAVPHVEVHVLSLENRDEMPQRLIRLATSRGRLPEDGSSR